MKSFLKSHWPEILFFLPLFFLSLWLMWHTFGYHDSIIYIASKIWGDFAANLPLIRSFSSGDNFPPEYPLFPGEPIRYHFLFYALVGLLEKMGLPINLALNLPSALSFFFLLIMIYLLTKELFKSQTVAFLAVIFFLFNGTFSFLEFLKTHPLSLNPASGFQFLASIFRLTEYPSFMPYGPGEVTAFWSLNTYLNQRHLALALALLLLIVYKLLRTAGSPPISPFSVGDLNRSSFFFGLLFGLLPSLHKAVFVMAILVLFCLFLFFKKLRLQICLIGLIGLICALPQLYFTNQLSPKTESAISFYPGYLVYGQGVLVFLRHWLMNLGLNVFLIPIGFILSPRQAKKIFLAFFSLFVIGNLFKFSPEIAANHKFFNLFIIVGNMYSAYALVTFFHKFSSSNPRGAQQIFEERKERSDSPQGFVPQKISVGRLQRITVVFIVIIFVFFLTFSGLIDLLVIKNDFQYQITDAPKNPDVLFIKTHTLPKSTFLTTSYFYHPANLAGRKIFYGWPYYAWSAGYQTEPKKELVRQIFSVEDVEALCQLLKTNKIDYVALEKEISIEEVKNLNQNFWKKNFMATYTNEVTGLKIYQTEAICLP